MCVFVECVFGVGVWCVCVGVRVCVLTMTERVIGFAAGEDR